ncbi:MAG: Alcohol dehydrogenase zinc-binding domain protein [Dehalococcoidia bacterium]|nr:Alcohol dehydrogenase zinc-binding domain protein [Dehalococcoidia bacterium]
MKGKAAIFIKAGKPMEIVEYPLPKVQPGAMLVKVKRANICGSDVHMVQGGFSWGGPELPHIIGHEMVGEVYELGAGLTSDSTGQPLKVGDRVTYCYFRPCGRCYACLHGQSHACAETLARLGMTSAEPPHFLGAFAEYYYIYPDQVVYKVPDELSDELVAPANCALSQVLYGLHEVHVETGDTVVLQGAGGLGINAIAVAREMGAGMVIVVEQHPERIKLAKAFGADYIVDINEFPTPRERTGQVRRLTQGRGADVVAELTGIPQVAREGIGMVRMGGRYLWIGNINPGKMVEIDPSAVILGNRTIVGTGRYAPWALYRALDFLKRTKDKYPFESVLSHSFKLEDINAAFEMAVKGKVTRASIVP